MPDVLDIKKNIFDGKQIATYLIIKNNTQKNIIQAIRTLLEQQDILFNTPQFPLPNDIIINEKMILQNEFDFDIILNEIESQKIFPINVERNKLYLYEHNSLKKIFQRFSLICFKNEIEKMEAVNHLNSILYKGKNNVLQYNIELHYASIDEHIFSKDIRDQIPLIFQQFKGIKDFQQNVVSLESPVEKTYIGFDSMKHLKKCHIKFINKIKTLLSFNDPKLFWKKNGIEYLYIKYKSKDLSNQIDKLIEQLPCTVCDIQKNCTEIEYSYNNTENKFNLLQFYVTYLGFKTFDDSLKSLSMIGQTTEMEIGLYNGSKSFISVVDEPKESFLFYDAF